MPLCARPAATDLGLESGISCFSDGNYGCAVQHREGSFRAHDALASFRQAPLLNLAATVFGLESVISSFSDRNYGCAVQYSEGSVLAHDGLASVRQALLLDLAATDLDMKCVTSCFSDGHYGCAVQVSEGSLLAHDARAPFRQARLLGMAATPRSPDTNQHDDISPAAVAEVKVQAVPTDGATSDQAHASGKQHNQDRVSTTPRTFRVNTRRDGKGRAISRRPRMGPRKWQPSTGA